MEQKVIVILSVDIKILGVEAVVHVPEGGDPMEVYLQWLAQDAKTQAAEDGEEINVEEHSEGFIMEVMKIEELA